MVNKFYPLLFLFIVFSIFSCTDDKSDVIILQDSINNQSNENNVVTDNIDTILRTKEKEYLKNLDIKEKKKLEIEKASQEINLSKKELLDFLPETLEGFKQLPASTGKTIENNNALTIYARKQFIDDKKRSILFDIFDYGRGNPVNNSVIYDSNPKDLDATATPYITDDVKGFFYWLNQKSYGHFEVMIDNRFVVMIRLSGFKHDDETLKEYISMINIKNLILSGKR